MNDTLVRNDAVTQRRAADPPAAHRRPPHWRFPALLLLALTLLLVCTRPYFGGDVVEYTTDAVAAAAHGTPDIRMEDVERTRALLPRIDGPLLELEMGMRAGSADLFAAFVRGRNGAVYPVHFFGYPLLASGPMKVLAHFGLPPFKAFLVVNYAALFVLGLAMRSFFRSDARALLGLALFLGCGGVLYLNWTSPELVSAACLLAGLLLYLDGAPLAGGILGGLASLQNPTIVFFFVFAPLLGLWRERERHPDLRSAMRAQFTRANLTGLAAGACVFALPPLFNLIEFGVPNIIARKFSDPGLISGIRLVSFFFDLNQGMLLGIPGVATALLLWPRNRRELGTLGLCLLFTLAMALPALAVLNWNSGAAGIMRYAFWGAMPLLLALLLRLSAAPAWPRGWIAGVALVQAAAMAHAASYPYVRFSPLASLVLAWAPQWYHPEPEIYAERAGVNDDYIQPGRIYAFGAGAARKTLYHAATPGAEGLLCGAGAVLAPGNHITESAHGWRYIDGPVRCQSGGVRVEVRDAGRFDAAGGVTLAAGWSGIESNGPSWHGVWSDGPTSRLVVALPTDFRPSTVTLRGVYLAGNTRTRVRINGVDLGWQALDPAPPLLLPQPLKGTALTIELEHENPHSPGPADARRLAFFLSEVRLRAAAP
jgi:hypothetical protein